MLKDQIDPRFTQAASAAKRRKRAARRGRLLIALVAFVPVILLGLGVWFTWDKWSFNTGGGEVAEEDLEEGFAISSDEDTAAASSAFVAAFVDLAGDPLIIRFAENGEETKRKLEAPATLRGTPRAPRGELLLVSDVMVSTEARFVTTLPSSQEDFAFFQLQKSAPQQAEAADAEDAREVAEALEAEGAEEVAEDLGEAAETEGYEEAELDDATGGWGEAVGDEEEGVPGFTETAIENTTSVVYTRPQDLRTKLDRDIFVKIQHDRPLDDLLIDNGFFENEAKKVAEAAREYFEMEGVKAGQVVAMRGQPELGGSLSFRQMSIYDNEVYFGTLALTDEGDVGPGSDPWVDDELFDYAGEDEAEEVTEQRYRMLDAFYSAAIRNGIPSVIVGEAIALLSKEHDLSAFANPGDKMRFLYAPPGEGDEGGDGSSRILYISIQGDSVDIECFVYATNAEGDMGCFGLKPKAGGGGGLVSGMVTPVKGVLTSRFGPRHHPILKTVRVHKGVDWAAPTGTPIYAAFDGTVSYTGPGGGYGNLLKITHAGGMETRYAHLSKFGSQPGQRVSAGDVVGYVGTTGRSTGPHLHFELYLGGTAIDPLGSSVPSGGGGVGGMTADGSGAVEQLVNQIIRVESGGNATAKNPLSTATGLGQFIESTWIRMMRTYRPDLASTLSRAELLALRNDPTISREMVKRLAMEGESYLRARGHGITAGRLYLCHFLGAQGAAVVLSNPDDALLIDVLGAGVIRANPFLTGKTVGYVKSWAERKMSGRKGAVVVTSAPVIREPGGLPDYRKEIGALLTRI
ncbi:peptidoglycan DD-metalloendopeptidase family protein [Vannielia litorea]|uniref:peptidoglycan DD-metalloendopeptidase family protein n=1 Tax=Vannielia litorea TaxID=1217970 RepID=UPI001C955696|nr:M23 family metallopeptidase [Vannielia litorea]MBY6046755.1 M23 family metallopeptidase [Vannielia litorea]MBY6074169.1 M23 family metallopeptidase [Vannielia litorea]